MRHIGVSLTTTFILLCKYLLNYFQKHIYYIILLAIVGHTTWKFIELSVPGNCAVL